MEGIFVYADEALRKALRARAYRSGRSMSDIARDALFEALTVLVPEDKILAFTACEGPQFIIAECGGQYVFAWGPAMFDRIWAQDVADASHEGYGVIWCDSRDSACAQAREYFRALGRRDDAERWAEVERAFLSQVSHAGPPKRQKEDSAHAV